MARGALSSDHLRGTFLTALGVIILSPDALFIRLIETDRWTLISCRTLLVALALAAFLAVHHGRSAPLQFRAAGAVAFAAAGIHAASTILFICSITLTTVANTLLIISAAPLVAAVLSRIFLKEILPPRTWIASLFTVGGVAVIFVGSLGGGSLIGDLCALVAMFGGAGLFVLFRHASTSTVASAMALGSLLAGVATFPFASPLAISAQDASLLIVLGLLILPLAIVLIMIGPRYLPAPEVSLITLLETLLGPFWVWLVLSELPAGETLVGGALILLTVAVHWLLGLRKVKSRLGRIPIG